MSPAPATKTGTARSICFATICAPISRAVRCATSSIGNAAIDPPPLWMRPPGRCLEELYLLGHEQRTELGGEAFDEILVREHAGPMRASVGIVIEFPEM